MMHYCPCVQWSCLTTCNRTTLQSWLVVSHYINFDIKKSFNEFVLSIWTYIYPNTQDKENWMKSQNSLFLNKKRRQLYRISFRNSTWTSSWQYHYNALFCAKFQNAVTAEMDPQRSWSWRVLEWYHMLKHPPENAQSGANAELSGFFLFQSFWQVQSPLQIPKTNLKGL